MASRLPFRMRINIRNFSRRVQSAIARAELGPQVILLSALLTAVFLVYRVLLLTAPETANQMRFLFVMPSEPEILLQKPWTLLISFLFHASALQFLFTVIGIIVFGNLTRHTFRTGNTAVLPLFVAGSLISNSLFWMLRPLPLLYPTLQNMELFGASSGMMTLMVVAIFFHPEQMVRMYGIFPVQLKYVGRAMILFAAAGLLFKFNMPQSIMLITGALAGFILLMVMRRSKSFRKHLWKNPLNKFKAIKRETILIRESHYHEKPLSDEQFNEIRKLRGDYLDELLDKISKKGIDSLTKDELDFLKRYGKE